MAIYVLLCLKVCKALLRQGVFLFEDDQSRATVTRKNVAGIEVLPGLLFLL